MSTVHRTLDLTPLHPLLAACLYFFLMIQQNDSAECLHRWVDSLCGWIEMAEVKSTLAKPAKGLVMLMMPMLQELEQ